MTRKENYDELLIAGSNVADTLAAKAEQSEVDSLSTTVGEKADQDGDGTASLSNYASIDTDDLYTDGRIPDVFAIERSGGWVAFDASGELASGSDGWSVIETAIQQTPANGLIYAKGSVAADSTIALDGGKELYAPDLDVEVTTTTTPAFEIMGSVVGDVALAADASAGDLQLSVNDASGISEGDIVAPQKAVQFSGDSTDIGEGHRVRSVDTTNGIVEIEDSLVYDYPTADSAQITHISPATATIDGVLLSATPSDSLYDGITIQNAIDTTVRSLTTDGFGRRGVLVRDGYNVRVTGSEFRRGKESTKGYGVLIAGASANVHVSDCQFHDCRHATALVSGPSDNGLPREAVIADNFASAGLEAVFDAHGEAISVTVRGNEIHTRDNRPATLGAKYNRFIDNVVYGSTAYSDRGAYANATHIIRGNEFRRGEGVRLYNHTDCDVVRIVDNEFADPDSALVVSVEVPVGMLDVRGNYFGDVSDYDSYQLRVRAAADSATIRDNHFAPSGRFGINFDSGGTNITVIGNEFIEPNTDAQFTGGAVGLASVEQSVVADNHIVRNTTGSGRTIRFTSGAAGGNTLRDNTIIGTAVLSVDDPVAVFNNEGMSNQTATPPDTRTGRLYLDDGTNRGDSSPGYRYWNGSTWDDL